MISKNEDNCTLDERPTESAIAFTLLNVNVCVINAPWSKTAKNTDWSTGPLARPFARSLARSLRSLPHSWDSYVLDVGIGNFRSLPKLIVGVSVWRVNSAAETGPLDFASFSLFLKRKLEITQELWGQLCSNRALLKENEKLCHTMFSTERKTVALSRHNFKKIKNLKITREFF